AVPERETASREKRTELALVPTETGAFRFAYWTTADRAGIEEAVLVDAADRTILRTANTNVSSNCSPTQPPTMTPAIGVPVRPDLASQGIRRNLYGNWAPRAEGFLHEAHWTGDAFSIPKVTVYQYTFQTPFMCTPERWTVFPVRAVVNQQRTYDLFFDDYFSPTWKGSAAGDALYRTRQTMEAFRASGRY